MWFIHISNGISFIQEKEQNPVIFDKRMELGVTTLSEISQVQKDKYSRSFSHADVGETGKGGWKTEEVCKGHREKQEIPATDLAQR